MKTNRMFNITIEDDAGYIWEGIYYGSELDIGDTVMGKVESRPPQMALGTVIMFEEHKDV